MAAQRAMLRQWIRHQILAFLKVPKSVLRPDIFTKSAFTQLEFARLAHWVVRGQPREDEEGVGRDVRRGSGFGFISSLAVSSEKAGPFEK